MAEERVFAICHEIDGIELICAITVKGIFRGSYKKRTVAVKAFLALMVLILG
jgi:hypothetical protein